MPTDTQSPVALITGGAGGIGTAMAKRLYKRYQIVIADLDGGRAKQVADEVGGGVVEVDVSDLDSNRAMVDQVVSRYGRLDLVALNAGVNAGQRGGEAVDLEDYRRTVAVNMDGVVFGIDAVIPALMERGGAVVVTSSVACLAPEVSNAYYTLARSAVLGYVRAMAAPLDQYAITINVLCPAFVDTPMLGARRDVLIEAGFPMLAPDEIAAALESVVDGGLSGQAWALIAGRPPLRYEFPGLPSTLLPDGQPAPELQLPPPIRRTVS